MICNDICFYLQIKKIVFECINKPFKILNIKSNSKAFEHLF